MPVVSNIDRLDAEAFHHALVDLVDNLAGYGATVLKRNVPKGETRRLEAAAGHTRTIDRGFEITAEVGIPAIEEALRQFRQVGTKDLPVPGEQDPSHYPIFVDRGTGEFGPTGSPIFARRANFMAFPGADGHTIFRHSVRGQRGQHFMLKTYTEMVSVLPAFAKAWAAQVKLETEPDPL